MVFARTGQMDRAVDFIRRALYCYECAFIEVGGWVSEWVSLCCAVLSYDTIWNDMKCFYYEMVYHASVRYTEVCHPH